eukprot:1157574-Pelagomonas_calceolata.AAC.9
MPRTPGASRFSRAPQKEGSDIEEELETHLQVKGGLAEGSESEEDGEGHHSGGKRRTSGPSAVEMQVRAAEVLLRCRG